MHEFLARQLQDLLLVISKLAAIIIAPRHCNGASRHSRPPAYAQLGKVEQDRDQDDREHFAATPKLGAIAEERSATSLSYREVAARKLLRSYRGIHRFRAVVDALRDNCALGLWSWLAPDDG